MNSTDTRELDLILERDPAGAYAAMDETTRERYRQACRELAAWSKKEPHEVAREALRLSEEREAGDERGRHVGAQLIAEGRPQLEGRLGCLVPRGVRASRFLRQHGERAYLGTIAVLMTLAVIGVERLLASQGLPVPHRVFVLVGLSPSLLEFFQERVNAWLSRYAAKAEPLPRLEPARVLTPDTRTIVVTPLLVTSATEIENQLRRLEINYLGNVAPELYFALLTDFCDAPEKELPGEQAMLEQLERGIRELNERHGYREQPRFFYFHRERRWNPVAGRWMGWERKRGKLDEFNRLVLGARDTSYTGAVPGLVHTLRYVITLDADTHLLPGSAARMVATSHHPLNRARFDGDSQRVIAGYSLLQPNSQLGPNRSQWLATGGWPMSIAREKKRAQPEMPWALQQRLFGHGDFLGKGIYDVAAFTRSLEGRLPENAILSHDKIEGMYARVAFVHDIHIFESPPKDLSVFARIWHRWLRGDWQLLPWLLPTVPAQDGRRMANSLSLFHRWKLLLDLCRGLHYPSSLLVLAYGWLFLPVGSVGEWTLYVSLWMCRHSFLFALGHTFRLAWGSESFLAGLRLVAILLPRILVSALVNVAAILPATSLVLDATLRVLYRLAFDRSRMLDWTTHAQSSNKARGLALLSLPEVRGAMMSSLGLGALLAVFNPGALLWASPFLVSWLALAVTTFRERPSPKAMRVPGSELEQLRGLARSAWSWYEQGTPTGGQPTHGGTEASPTDLALALVAPLSAYHLDYLKLDGLLSRLDESLALLAGLERHRGHFLERYDLRERRPVGPRHISTAESGAMAASLLLVESGLRAARLAASGEAPRARLGELEARARALHEEMDFTFLYDAEAELLHVGYDVESGALDSTHHGLLTSSAMLAGFVAIARKQAPLAHWVALAASDQRLRKASAPEAGQSSLADHLLPSLFLWYPPRTLLAQAATATVDAGLGTSEARRALPAGQPQPAPIAPHLSVLTLRFRPEHALENLRRVAKLGGPEASGEAAGPRALSSREQAMALAAVANVACDDILVQHFHQHWQTAWVEALVFETKDTP